MPEIPTVIIVSDPNIGDAICAMHAVQVLAKDRKLVYLHSLNAEVELLMRPRNAKSISEIPESGLYHVKHFSIQNCFRRWGRGLGTPEQHYLKEAGLPGVPIPKARIDLLEVFNKETGTFDKPDVPQAGLVIAPFTQDRDRMWPVEKWNYVIESFLGADVPITVVGAASDPQPWDEVDYYYGRPLSDVGYLMRKAEFGVLSIDSGPSRLAQVVGVKRHVVLSPVIYPEAWVAEPESIQVRSLGPERPDWNPDEVIDAVLRGI
jgi:hypothetical protein